MSEWKSIAEIAEEYKLGIQRMQAEVDALLYRADHSESQTRAFNLRRQANKLSDAIGSSQYALSLMQGYLREEGSR